MLSIREFLVRTKTSGTNENKDEKVIKLHIIDEMNHESDDITLKISESLNEIVENKKISVFHVRTQQELGETIRKIKLHTSSVRKSSSENATKTPLFLEWIELIDFKAERKFYFPVDDYLPSSPGDVLELSVVHQNPISEEDKKQYFSIEYLNKKNNHIEESKSKIQSHDHLKSIKFRKKLSESDTSIENNTVNMHTNQHNIVEQRSTYSKLYDIRTKTAHQGFLGINSATKANVFVKFHDINQTVSESIPLAVSRLHKRPFRSNQTDQFQVGTNVKLGQLKKIEIWHDGKKGTRLHCGTIEITDQSNGQIYCFQANEYLDSETRLILTDYDNRRCIDIHFNDQSHPTMNNGTYENKDDNISVLTNAIQSKDQVLQRSKQKNSSILISDIITDNFNSETNSDQTLFKIRTKVTQKSIFPVVLSGTDLKVYIRMHQDDKTTDDILLNNSLTHDTLFESGHIDVFEVAVSKYILSPDKIEIFCKGKMHDGLDLKWIEIMNMNTFERKCFPVNQQFKLNDHNKKSHFLLERFTIDESCEEHDYHEHHSRNPYQTEYLVRTKTSVNQPMNNINSYANIYLKIYNDKQNHTEDMLLKNSKTHKNSFQPGKIDKFDIGSICLMNDTIDKIELWHDDTSDFLWYCEWIEIKNKNSDSIKCFGVNRLLSSKSFGSATKLVLTIHSHYPCDRIEQEFHNLTDMNAIQDRRLYVDKIKNTPQRYHNLPTNVEFTKKYIVTTKTGNKMSLDTHVDVFIRFYDEQNRQSEDILLKQTVTNKIPFQKHAIDEFHTGTLTTLTDLIKIHLWHNDEKNETWTLEWLQIQDIEINRLYCFPMNKSIALNSNSRTICFILTEFTINEPCSNIIYQKNEKESFKLPMNYELKHENNKNKTKDQSVQFKRSYHVETKTGMKGFLGLSPTGTNSKVFIQIYDKNGRISEPIELQNSINHKNKFERGQTDEFDIGSSLSLNGIDKLELWHENTNNGHGWFVDYVNIIDNYIEEEACFFVGKYLNKKNGGVEEKHLILEKQSPDNRPCREHNFDTTELMIQETLATESLTSPFVQTYFVRLKTDEKGFSGLDKLIKDARVFIRIHDNNDKLSEPIQLNQSLKYNNNFEKSQIDQFDVGTHKKLDGIKKIELWLENNKMSMWKLDYIEVLDNRTEISYCFIANFMFNENFDLPSNHILLENPALNVSCSDQLQLVKNLDSPTVMDTSNSKNNYKIERNFTIRTKTGNQIEAGSTTPIHIQLYDDHGQISEDIRLKNRDHDQHNFEPGSIDEFQITTFDPLSNKLIGIRIKHNADKYQGWYAEWIEIIDEDNSVAYCFPIQRWIDKAENDKQTDVYFSHISKVPCNSLPNTMLKSDYHQSRPVVQETDNGITLSSIPLPQTLAIPFENTYHIKIKTGDQTHSKIIPIRTKAKVFIRIIDKKGNTSENFELCYSTNHKNEYQPNQTDEFDIGSSKKLNEIEEIELWTDEKDFRHDWFLDYVQVIDNKTGNVACFPLSQYFNYNDTGSEKKPLRLQKTIDEQFCQSSIVDINNDELQELDPSSNPNTSSLSTKYKNTYTIMISTNHIGLFNISTYRTSAPVFIRIQDTVGKVSNPIQLQNSIKYKDKVQRNRIDQFDVGSDESLEGISRIQLWQECDKRHECHVKYIQIIDNQTNISYCFCINTILDVNMGVKDNPILLVNPIINSLCINSEESVDRNQISLSMPYSQTTENSTRNFTIRTKTGSEIEAGSTTPIYIQFFDDNSQKSKKICLKQQDQDRHHFRPGSIDEFYATFDQPLNELVGIEISHHADKYQGWYCEWISVIDHDKNKTYCFPLQRWIDKGELDGNTDIYFQYIPNMTSCEQLDNTMKRNSLQKTTINQKLFMKDMEKVYKSIYVVQIKSAKEAIGRLKPIESEPRVLIRIHDRDDNVSEALELKNSNNYKNMFGQGTIDEYEIRSIHELNGINKLELWADSISMNDDWYPDYIRIKDKKTSEISCFFVRQYLNKKSDTIIDDHLLLSKQDDNRMCHDLEREDTTYSYGKILNQIKQEPLSTIESHGRFEVEVKTGHTGFMGLGGAGVDASAFIRIYDSNERISEVYELKHPTTHKNKFQRNQTDHFIIHTDEQLENISKLDLWYDGNENIVWKVDYINIIDNKTNTSYCFLINAILHRNSGLKHSSIHLENPSINSSCTAKFNEIEQSHNYPSVSKKLRTDKLSRNYTVQIKTGNHPSAGSTTPIHLQLIDMYNKKSKDIRLKKKDMEGHHFAPGAVDEFKMTLLEPLSTLKAVQLSLDADKYQGWYGEWISIIDDDNQETYCFPIQRWLDKGENDHKTHITLYQQSNISCHILPDSILIQPSQANNDDNEQLSNADIDRMDSIASPFLSDYSNEHNDSHYFQLLTKTANKSLQGKLGLDATVYLNIYDKSNKKIGDSIPIPNSKTHKVPFQRHHTDKFDIKIPNIKINDIDRIDLYHDGQNDGWFCDFVEIKSYQTKETKCFSVHKWLDKVSDDDIQFSMTNYQNIPCDEKSYFKNVMNYQYYTIRIKVNATNLTSNDSVNIFIKLIGKLHQTEKIELDRTIDNRQAFRQNNTIDTFEIRTPVKLNSLKKLEVFYEFSSINRKVSLEWIEITNLSNGIISCFPVNRILTQLNINKGMQQLLTLNEFNNQSCS